MLRNTLRRQAKKSRRNRRRFRPQFETLETRRLLAMRAFHGLDFEGDFDNGPVDVRVGGDATTLLVLEDGVSFQGERFTSIGTVGVKTDQGTKQLIRSDGVSFDAADLLPAGGGVTVENADSATIKVSGVDIKVTSLKIVGTPNDYVIQLLGDVTLSAIPGFNFALAKLPGSPFVEAGINVSETGNDVRFAKDLSVKVNGEFTLGKVRVEAQNLTLAYKTSENRFEFSGGVNVELTDKLIVKASISPSTPLRIDTSGNFSVGPDGITIDGSVKFGPFSADVTFTYKNGDNFAGKAILHLPQSMDVEGGFKFSNGELSSVSIGIQKDIRIGSTPFKLTGLTASLKNLANPENIMVSGSVTVKTDKKFQVLGKDLIVATGRFTIDKDHLALDANVKLLDGLLPGGTALAHGMAGLDLNWTTGVYQLRGYEGAENAKLTIAGAITYEGNFYFDRRGNFGMFGSVTLTIPKGLLFEGEDLGSAELYVSIRPGQGDSLNYVKVFGRVLSKEVGVEYNLNSNKWKVIWDRPTPPQHANCSISGGGVQHHCTYTDQTVIVRDYYDYYTLDVESEKFQKDGFGSSDNGFNGFGVTYKNQDGKQLDATFNATELTQKEDCQFDGATNGCFVHKEGSKEISIQVPAFPIEVAGERMTFFFGMQTKNEPLFEVFDIDAGFDKVVFKLPVQQTFPKYKITPHIKPPTIESLKVDEVIDGTTDITVNWAHPNLYDGDSESYTVSVFYENSETKATGIIHDYVVNVSNDEAKKLPGPLMKKVETKFKWYGLPALFDTSDSASSRQHVKFYAVVSTVSPANKPVSSKKTDSIQIPDPRVKIETSSEIEPDVAFGSAVKVTDADYPVDRNDLSVYYPDEIVELEVSVNRGGNLEYVDNGITKHARSVKITDLHRVEFVMDELESIKFKKDDTFSGGSEITIKISRTIVGEISFPDNDKILGKDDARTFSTTKFLSVVAPPAPPDEAPPTDTTISVYEDDDFNHVLLIRDSGSDSDDLLKISTDGNFITITDPILSLGTDIEGSEGTGTNTVKIPVAALKLNEPRTAGAGTRIVVATRGGNDSVTVAGLDVGEIDLILRTNDVTFSTAATDLHGGSFDVFANNIDIRSNLKTSGTGEAIFKAKQDLKVDSAAKITVDKGQLRLDADGSVRVDNAEISNQTGSLDVYANDSIHVDDATISVVSGDLSLSADQGIQVSNDARISNIAGELILAADKGIQVSSSAKISNKDGNLFLLGNTLNDRSTGDFKGVHIDGGTVEITGAGGLVVRGVGGDADGGRQVGVQVSDGGEIIGGLVGSSFTIEGSGGAGGNSVNSGVWVNNPDSIITSRGADVDVKGWGGGVSSDSTYDTGVSVNSGGAITAGGNGNVSVLGTGGRLGGNRSWGVEVIGDGTNGATISAPSGDVYVEAVAGAGGSSPPLIVEKDGKITASGNAKSINIVADDVVLDNTSTINAYAVALGPKTLGTAIDIGTNAPDKLGLTDEELTRITATLLRIGNDKAGELFVSEPIERPPTTFKLEGRSIQSTSPDQMLFNGNVTLGKGMTYQAAFSEVNESPTYTPLLVNFKLEIQEDVKLKLNALDGFQPTAGKKYVIGAAHGGVSGEFAGHPEGAVIKNFLGSDLEAKITYSGVGDEKIILLSVREPVPTTSVSLVDSPNGTVLLIKDDNGLDGDSITISTDVIGGINIATPGKKITTGIDGTTANGLSEMFIPIASVPAGGIRIEDIEFMFVKGFKPGVAVNLSAEARNVKFDDDASEFNESGTDLHGGSLNIQADRVLIEGDLVTRGTGNLDIVAERTIDVVPGALVQTVDGSIGMTANLPILLDPNEFGGVRVDNATIESTGAGDIVIYGMGGESSGGNDVGVQLVNGAKINGGTSGIVTIDGSGGRGGGDDNFGVKVLNSTVSSRGAHVLIVGTGGGLADGGEFNDGVALSTGTKIDAGGEGFVVVQGYSGYGTDTYGLYIQTGATISSSGGDIEVLAVVGTQDETLGLGIEGNITAVNNADVYLSADDIDISSTGKVDATDGGFVRIRPYTLGTEVDLGTNANGKLGLTDAELDRIIGGSVLIGSKDTGNITFTDSISTAQALFLVSGGVIADSHLGEFDYQGPQLYMISNVQAGTTPGVMSINGDAALSGNEAIGVAGAYAVSFGGTLPGGGDNGFHQLSVTGDVNIQPGVTLELASINGFVPQAGDSFDIVRRGSGMGEFVGVPEGTVFNNFLKSGEDAVITYVGGASNSDIVLTVLASNNAAPTISDIANQSVQFGEATSAITFTVGDGETAKADLEVTATSSDTTLIPNSADALALGGSGADRTITVTPAEGQTGTATITVMVTDGGLLTATETFDVTVEVAIPGDRLEPNNINLDAINVTADVTQPGLSIHEASDVDFFTFTIPEGTTATSADFVEIRFAHATGDLDLRLLDSDGNELRTSNSETDDERITLADLPADDYFIAVYPFASSEAVPYEITFDLPEQTTVNTPPTITDIANQTVAVGEATSPLVVTVGDADTAAGTLNVTATSSDTTLVPAAGIVLGGSGADRTITVTPAAGQTGRATITVTVTDEGGLTATDTFDLTVEASDPGDRFEPNNNNLDAINVTADVTHPGLSIHNFTDADFFTFTISEGTTATSADVVEIRFEHATGDLDLDLLDSDGNELRTAVSETDDERITLDGLTTGVYFVVVYSAAGSDPVPYEITFNLPNGGISLPSGQTEVSVENGNIVVRNDSTILYEASRASVAELKFIGGDEDSSLAVGDLGKINGESVRIHFEGTNAAFKLLGQAQTIDLTNASGISLEGVESLDIAGTGPNTLKLSVAQILTLSSGSGALTIQHDEDDTVDYGGGWTVQPPTLIDGLPVHRLSQGLAEVRVVNTRPWQNPLNALDPNRDGSVSPIDALLIINTLNSVGSRELAIPLSVAELPEFYFDSNGDRSVSAIDVLQVINFLNQGVGGAGEGEGSEFSHGVAKVSSDLQFPTASVDRSSGERSRVDANQDDYEQLQDQSDWTRLSSNAFDSTQSSQSWLPNEQPSKHDSLLPLEELFDELASDITNALTVD